MRLESTADRLPLAARASASPVERAAFAALCSCLSGACLLDRKAANPVARTKLAARMRCGTSQTPPRRPAAEEDEACSSGSGDETGSGQEQASLRYLAGFGASPAGHSAGARPLLLERSSFAGNEHASESVAGTLPVGQNNPQACADGLYAEQLSGAPLAGTPLGAAPGCCPHAAAAAAGTAFTVPRHANLRSWLYRTHPSVGHEPFQRQASRPLCATPGNSSATPNQLRWLPPAEVDEGVDFVDALFTVCGSGRRAAAGFPPQLPWDGLACTLLLAACEQPRQCQSQLWTAAVLCRRTALQSTCTRPPRPWSGSRCAMRTATS